MLFGRAAERSKTLKSKPYILHHKVLIVFWTLLHDKNKKIFRHLSKRRINSFNLNHLLIRSYSKFHGNKQLPYLREKKVIKSSYGFFKSFFSRNLRNNEWAWKIRLHSNTPRYYWWIALFRAYSNEPVVFEPLR